MNFSDRTTGNIIILLEVYDREAQKWMIKRGKDKHLSCVFEKELEEVLNDDAKKFEAIFNGRKDLLEDIIQELSQHISWIESFTDYGFYSILSNKWQSIKRSERDIPYVFKVCDPDRKVKEDLPDDVSPEARDYLDTFKYDSFTELKGNKLHELYCIIEKNYREDYIDQETFEDIIHNFNETFQYLTEHFKSLGYKKDEQRFLIVYEH